MHALVSLVLGVSVVATAASWASIASAADPVSAPTILDLPEDWYPESLAAGSDGTLYVGSWRQGAVARLRPGTFAPEILVKPASNGLANGQGLLVDENAGLLWICSGTIGFTTVPTTPSALKSYDLANGTARASYTLPDAGYCNDLVQATDGTIYVTDSYHPRILALSPGDSSLYIWLEDSRLSSGDAKFFLNGIALDRKGALYVSTVMAASFVLKVSKTAQGAAVVQHIEAPRIFKNVDALRYVDDSHLLLFESDAFGKDGPYGGAITLATLSGDRITQLQTLVSGLNNPSSGLILHDRLWYIESKYGLLLTHPNDETGVPRHVPFYVGSVSLAR